MSYTALTALMALMALTLHTSLTLLTLHLQAVVHLPTLAGDELENALYQLRRSTQERYMRYRRYSWRTRCTNCAASCYSLPKTYYPLLLLTTYYPLLATHYSLSTIHYPLLTTHHPLLTAHCLLLATHYLLLTTHYPLLITQYSLLAGGFARGRRRFTS